MTKSAVLARNHRSGKTIRKRNSRSHPEIGKMMGHSFRPWEAVKMARGIGAAGAVLSVASIGISVYLQMREDQAEERKAEDARKKRQQVRAHYASIAQKIRAEAMGITTEYIERGSDKTHGTNQTACRRPELGQAGTEPAHTTPRRGHQGCKRTHISKPADICHCMGATLASLFPRRALIAPGFCVPPEPRLSVDGQRL